MPHAEADQQTRRKVSQLVNQQDQEERQRPEDQDAHGARHGVII